MKFTWEMLSSFIVAAEEGDELWTHYGLLARVVDGVIVITCAYSSTSAYTVIKACQVAKLPTLLITSADITESAIAEARLIACTKGIS